MSKKFDLIVKSEILVSEKPSKAIDAYLSDNPNKPNKLKCFLPDGTAVKVAQRSGKGGLDFNKFLNGKIFAVAADGFSPVYEKGEDKKPTKVQKIEDGLPLYSSSGFYLLSSKDYPAQKLFTAYTRLIARGEKVLLVEPTAAVAEFDWASDFDTDLIDPELEALLSDDFNCVSMFDEGANKKRKRELTRAKEEAEDNNEEFAGPEYADLKVSPKDGNSFVLLVLKNSKGVFEFHLKREAEVIDDGKLVMEYYDAPTAVQKFKESKEYNQLLGGIEEGAKIYAIRGNLMRTSVSFKTKCTNVLEKKVNTTYGDAVYIQGALTGWTKGICSMMYSQHPKFPNEDYPFLNYVVACRQAEIGMNKTGDKYSAPQAVLYSPEELLNLMAR